MFSSAEPRRPPSAETESGVSLRRGRRAPGLGEAQKSRRGGQAGAPPGLLPPFLVGFFFFFPLLSLPLPFLFVKGGGRQRRAGVSGRGLEFHLNDCPCAHAAPRSRPACAPQSAPAPCRPAGGRLRRGPGTASSPSSPAPDLADLGAAATASPASRTPDEGSEVLRGRAGWEPHRRRRRRRRCRKCAAPGLCPLRGAPQCQTRSRAQAAGRRWPSRADRGGRPLIWNLDPGAPLQGWCPGRGPGAVRRLPLGAREEEETQPVARAAGGPRLPPVGGRRAEGAGD